MLEGAHGARAPLVFDARAGQLRLAGCPRNPRRFDLVLRVLQPGCRRGAVRLDPVGLHAHVIFLDIQLRQRFGDPFARGRRVLEGVAQRSRRVDGRKDFAASRLDIRFQAFDATMGRFVRERFRCQRRSRPIALGIRVSGRLAPRRERGLRRFATRFERQQLRLD